MGLCRKCVQSADEKYLTFRSVLAINKNIDDFCMHHFQTDSSCLPRAIQAVRPPPFLFKCALMSDSNQYLKAEFRNDR